MKVLQVISSTNIGSGIANVVMNYYRNIDREQVQFDFLIFWEAPVNYNKEIESLGGRVYYFTKPGLTTYFKAKKELRNFFAEHKGEYDIVHCHEILVAKPVFEAARKQGGVKVCISHSHNSRLADSFVKKVRNRIAVLGLAKKSDYCFACSKPAAENAFGKAILKSSKYKFIYNAVNLARFSYSEESRKEIREEFQIEDKIVFCNVGRFCYQKNQIFAVRVLQAALSQGKDAVLMLVGKGEDEQQLKDYVRSCDIEGKVIFTGARNDVDKILCAADVLVFPSRYEGLPVVMVEAQATGLPVLYSDTVTDEAAVLPGSVKMPLKEEKKWAEAACSLAGGCEDRKSALSAVENAGFGIDRAAAKLSETYKEICR